MKALTFEGQFIINDSKMRGAINRTQSVSLIHAGIAAIRDHDIDSAKKIVYKAYELISDACPTALITDSFLKLAVLTSDPVLFIDSTAYLYFFSALRRPYDCWVSLNICN